jgi:hypothetical protein
MGWKIHVMILGRGGEFFSSSEHPDQLRVPLSLYSGNQGFFTWVKVAAG